ncbi:MAG: hypothetical protein P1P84_23740 [Deferrisomatales bacterium]|nr:hypothetical protein [Deferrisomatales bacterium]
MMRRLAGMTIAISLTFVLGCGGVSVRTYAKPATGERQYGKVKKVAILPFDSVVEGAQAPKIAGDLFLQDLLARGTFEDVEEPRYVAELMKKLKLRNTENLDREIVRKIGEELQAQALIFGQILLFGVDDHSNIVEFVMQVNLLDVKTGNILWSSRSFADASTTWGQVLGVSEGPSVNDVAAAGVGKLVARLDNDFRTAREVEVETMLEAAKAQEIVGAEAPVGEAAPAAQPQIAPEDEAEEILLQVKPK